MNTVAGTRFAVKPVVAALALALSAVNAYADPTPTQLPGGGLIRAVNTGTTITSPAIFYLVTGGGIAGDKVINGSAGAPYFPGSIQLNNAGSVARAVIRWGGNGPGIGELLNPQGFNIGQNATVFFTSSATVTSAAVLNIDASGNPSQIFGKLIGTSDVTLGTTTAVSGVGGGAAPAIFVANTNGIIVGPLGQVQSPTGVALIAANLTNTDTGFVNLTTAEWDFIGNNGATSPAPPGVSGPSYLDVMGGITGKSKVDIRGFIDGGNNGKFASNSPAEYVLIVGGDVVNTGNIFGHRVDILAGMQSATGQATDTVNGISKVAVQRLFNVDTGFSLFNANGDECATSAACLEVSRTGSTFLNTGTIASKGLGGNVGIYAAGGASGIRTGTLGDPSPLVGIFSDNPLIMNTYEAGSTIELYGVLSGYSLNVLLPSLAVNQAKGWHGDVTVHTVQRGTEPSMLTTTGDVRIRGVNVTIDSTINHTANPLNDADLLLDSGGPPGPFAGIGSMNINADVGAGNRVAITNSGAGGINIVGNVSSSNGSSDDGEFNESLFVTNTASGSPTTISGNLNAGGSSGFGANVTVSVNGLLHITGNLDATYDINIINASKGATTFIDNGHMFAGENINMDVSGPTDATSNMLAGEDVNITQHSLAPTTTTLAGSITALNNINITDGTENDPVPPTGPITSKLYIDASLLADNFVDIKASGDLRMAQAESFNADIDILVGGLNVALTGSMVTENTFRYTALNALTKVYTSAQIEAGQIFINALNFRGVQDDGTNYTDVSQKPEWQLMTDNLDLVMRGSINAPIDGNTNWLLNAMQVKTATDGGTVNTAISAVGGGFQAINLGFTGNLAVTSGATNTPFSSVGFASPVLLPPPLVANGGSQLILQASGNIDINGTLGPFFPLSPVSFQFPGGVVFKADGYISLNAPLYNAWSVGGAAFQGVFFEAPTIITTSYIATNTLNWVNYSSYPLTGPANAYIIQQPAPNQFQFMPFPDATHYNVYSLEVVGGAPCHNPNPSPPWPPAGC